ncbi:hypothetical protein PAHAL_2G392200 [Panicum hallii]|jgi:hypothetical protein|uniref:Uncharacterized protein n=1 Tax=Panicum hallii TaxID=206008 RepID=A0A2S3H1R6_9POAL|nr:hypothetical protein PAHAL_2G392200 [Panicum hallii]
MCHVSLWSMRPRSLVIAGDMFRYFLIRKLNELDLCRVLRILRILSGEPYQNPSYSFS